MITRTVYQKDHAETPQLRQGTTQPTHHSKAQPVCKYSTGSPVKENARRGQGLPPQEQTTGPGRKPAAVHKVRAVLGVALGIPKEFFVSVNSLPSGMYDSSW